MKRLAILQFGAAELREKAKPVVIFNKNLHQIINNMAFTLKTRDDGAALAANQIGVLKQIIVIDTQDEYYEIINPEIIEKAGNQYGPEGCLSYSGFEGNVSRYNIVKVRYQDRNGKYCELEKEGFFARCLQHEIDHLNGVLYIDHVTESKIWNINTEAEIDINKIRNLSLMNQNKRA